MLGTLVMAGGDLCAMTRSSTLCGRSTLLGKSGLSALGRAAATLLTQEGHAQDMSFEIAANTAWPTRGSSRARGYAGPIGHTRIYRQHAVNTPFYIGKWRFSRTPPNRYAEQALLKHPQFHKNSGSAECCGKFAPRVDRKGATPCPSLCPAPRSRDGRH